MTTPASAPSTGPAAPLVVRTVPVDLADLPLLDLLPREQPVSWLRRGEGLCYEVADFVTDHGANGLVQRANIMARIERAVSSVARVGARGTDRESL